MRKTTHLEQTIKHLWFLQESEVSGQQGHTHTHPLPLPAWLWLVAPALSHCHTVWMPPRGSPRPEPTRAIKLIPCSLPWHWLINVVAESRTWSSGSQNTLSKRCSSSEGSVLQGCPKCYLLVQRQHRVPELLLVLTHIPLELIRSSLWSS